MDMQMSPYGCISTGDQLGMIEVVLNAATTANITQVRFSLSLSWRIHDRLTMYLPLTESWRRGGCIQGRPSGQLAQRKEQTTGRL